MASFNKQLQTKVTERQYRLVELRAHERGVTPSEFLREVLERECGQPQCVSLGERLAIELTLEVRTMLVQVLGKVIGRDMSDFEVASADQAMSARAEADRRIREAADRERTK